MAVRYEFREAFRNRSATELALVPTLATILQLILGLVFAALLLSSGLYCVLALIHVLFGIDPLSIQATFADIPKGAKGFVALLVGLLFTQLFFGTMAYWCLRAVKQRLFARLYVLSGKPLRSVEGAPIFDAASESGYVGIEIGEFYFSLEDCCLNVNERDLDKLRAAGGTLRIWYIPAGLRVWHNPTTGKTVRHGGLLTRAEWRP